MKRSGLLLSLFLSCVIVFSGILGVTENMVAGHWNNAINAVFWPDYYTPPPNGPDTETEMGLSYYTCYYVVQLLADHENNGCYWTNDATYSNYYSVLNTLAGGSYPGVVFTKGHNVPVSSSNYALLDHNGDHVNDYDIYDYTSSNIKFAFVWHCATTLDYPPSWNDYESCYNEETHAYCWTHDASMQNYWTQSGNQVFMGWNWTSPQFEEPCAEYSMWNYAHVCYLFWEHMCEEEGPAVWESWAYVCETVWGTGLFDDTPLYSRYVMGEISQLQIYGNMNLMLP